VRQSMRRNNMKFGLARQQEFSIFLNQGGERPGAASFRSRLPIGFGWLFRRRFPVMVGLSIFGGGRVG
jgi:hypothetical protein